MTLKAPTKTPLTVEYVIQIWDKLFDEDFFAETMMDYEDQKSELVVLDLSKMNNSDKFDCEEAIRSLTDAPRYAVSAISEILKREYPTIQEVSVLVKEFKWCTDIKHKIREMRSGNINQAVIFDGVIRNSTPVLSKLKAMAYECGGCRGTFLVEQDGDTEGDEPEECPLCSRVDEVFTHDEMNDVFINYVECEIEEEPEGSGGKQPERVQCQFSGALTEERVRSVAGNRVTFFGVHRVKKKEKKSLIYEKYIEILGADKKGRQYEEMEISEENKREFDEMSKSPTLMEDLAKSIAPNIFGYDMEKHAILLQMFGGNLYSERRGDIHILLVGEPGIGKTINGNSEVVLSNGQLVKIKELCEKYTDATTEDKVGDDVVYKSNFEVLSMNPQGKFIPSVASLVWKKKPDVQTYIVKTRSGRKMECTPTHPFYTWNGGFKVVKSEHLNVGEFVVIPRNIKINGKSQPTSRLYNNKSNLARVNLSLPEYTDEKFWRFVALLIGDGHIPDKKGVNNCGFTNNNSELIKEVAEYAHDLGMTATIRTSHPVKSATNVTMYSQEFWSMMFNECGGKSATKKWPSVLFECSNGEIASAISGLFDAEGHVNVKAGHLEISSASIKLLEETQYLFNRLGIHSYLSSKFDKKYDRYYYRLFISGKDVIEFNNIIPFIDEHKKEKIKKLLRPSLTRNTNIDIIPNVGEHVKRIRTEMKLLQKEMGVGRMCISHCERGDRNISYQNLDKMIKFISKSDKLNMLSDNGRRSLALLEKLADSDIMFDRVEEITIEKSVDDWVYDLQVDKYHNYIANNIVVHNSSLTKNITSIAPHVVKASGAPTTSVGLSACVRRDESVSGGYVVEAGAAVLASGGILLLDELDKMDKEVRGALHEIMEDQTISVNKANISTQLVAKCSILAIMNPKNNRFLKDEKTSEQIELPASLVSRFDLVFALKDIVDETKDERITEAIDRARDGEEITYIYTPETVTKYIQYARSKVKELKKNKEAKRIMTKKYIKIRQSNKGSEAVAITSRQYEGISRLAEAHAKMRLSSEVNGEDAKAALKIMEYYLHTMCLDPGTGELCIDTVMGGKCTSEKTRDASLLEVLIEIRSNIMKEYPDLTGAECLIDIDYAQGYFTDKGHTEKEFKKGLDSLISDMKITLQKGQSKIRIEKER